MEQEVGGTMFFGGYANLCPNIFSTLSAFNTFVSVFPPTKSSEIRQTDVRVSWVMGQMGQQIVIGHMGHA